MFSLDKNSLFLTASGLLVIGFIICGVLDILHYFIVKILLIFGFSLFIIAAGKQLIANYKKKAT